MVTKADFTTFRVDTPSATSKPSFISNLFDFVLFHLLQILLLLSCWVQRITPWINRLYANLQFEHVTTDRYDSILTFDCLYRQHAMEYAVSIDKAAQALAEYKSRIE